MYFLFSFTILIGVITILIGVVTILIGVVTILIGVVTILIGVVTILIGAIFVCFQMVCQFCYKMFVNRTVFVFHLRAVHKQGEPVRCPHCGKDDFKSRTSYIVHAKKCRQKNELA